MALLQDFAAIVGDEYALTGDDVARWSKDWTGKYCAQPGVVLRPASAQEVSRIMALADAERQSITPVSGHTGLVGGTYAPGGVMLSLDRMNTIHAINQDARTAVVDAGVVLSSLHDAADAQDLIYIDVHLARVDGAREPFDAPHDINILVEVATTSDVQITDILQTIMAGMMEGGSVLDAVVAQNETQRRAMWERREAAAELTFWRQPIVDTDVALPLDLVPEFLSRANARMTEIDSGAEPFYVSHLGDGNVHYGVYPSRDDDALKDQMVERIEDTVAELGGSFSAEHGVGLSKLNTMRRRKDPVALDMMRKIKTVLDPNGILNPGKLIPD